MQLSKESLQLFWQLLTQVSVKPTQEDADQVWQQVKKAREELEKLLLPVKEKDEK